MTAGSASPWLGLTPVLLLETKKEMREGSATPGGAVTDSSRTRR